MNSRLFVFAFLAIIFAAATNAQIFYNAPAVAEYAWPAVGESAPYYAAGYAGIPVAGYPYAYAIGSGTKGAAALSQSPTVSLTNNA